MVPIQPRCTDPVFSLWLVFPNPRSDRENTGSVGSFLARHVYHSFREIWILVVPLEKRGEIFPHPFHLSTIFDHPLQTDQTNHNQSFALVLLSSFPDARASGVFYLSRSGRGKDKVMTRDYYSCKVF